MKSFIKLIAEGAYIDPSEANNNLKSIKTLIDKKRKVAFVAKQASTQNEWSDIQSLINMHGLKSMYINGNKHDAYVVYTPDAEKDAMKLKSIAEKYKGYLAYYASEKDTREIGRILNYDPKKIEDFVKKQKEDPDYEINQVFVKENYGKKNKTFLKEIEFNSKLANKFEWKYDGGSNNRYTFNTGEDGNSGIDYEVKFIEHDGSVYERVYKPVGKGFENTNEGKPIKINATVMDITLDFMSKNRDWYNIIISPLDSKRHNLVKAFIDKSIPKNKYFVDSEEGIINITRNFKYNTSLLKSKKTKKKPKAAE